jgi:hypothetical protein
MTASQRPTGAQLVWAATWGALAGLLAGVIPIAWTWTATGIDDPVESIFLVFGIHSYVPVCALSGAIWGAVSALLVGVAIGNSGWIHGLVFGAVFALGISLFDAVVLHGIEPAWVGAVFAVGVVAGCLIGRSTVRSRRIAVRNA